MGEPRGRIAGQARALFGDPELRPLWAALRQRHERTSTPVRRVTVPLRSRAEREAVADLLGLDHLPGGRVTVSVERLDALIAEALPGLGAREVVGILSGPLADLSGDRARAAQARRQLWTWLEAHPTVVAEPGLLEWVAAVRKGGLVAGSIQQTRRLLERALSVLAALPADGRPLPSFAQAVTGDPHALDGDGRLATLVLRALASQRGEDPPADAEQRRRLWAEAGIACDALSTTVLVAGLHASGAGPLAEMLRGWTAAGEAASVTLAQLRGWPVGDINAPVCWVVENPSVVAEAVDRFGPKAPPLVCTAGWPNSAAMTLLRSVGSQGVPLRYHGDLDGEGVRIAAHVVERTGASVLAMSAEDYLRSVTPGNPPVGRVTDAPWDTALAPAMRAHGTAVPQEQVAAEILEAMVERSSNRRP
jgi:uncharacterized protein (TIGR02679 family)